MAARLIQGHNLTINHGAIREIAKCFDKMRVLTIEQFVPPRDRFTALSDLTATARYPSSSISKTQFEPSGSFETGAQSIGSMKSALRFGRVYSVRAIRQEAR